MTHKIPLLLLLMIGLAIGLGELIPLELKSSLYALSLTLKSFIIFALPFIIFMILFKTTAQLASRATKLILLLLGGVFVSNFVSTLLSYSIGSYVYGLGMVLELPKPEAELYAMWDLTIPKLIDNNKAMFAGLLLGTIVPYFAPNLATRISDRFEKIINKALQVIIILVPFFVLGFVVKMIHDHVIQSIMFNYAYIFALIGAAEFSYIGFLYFAASRFRLFDFIKSIGNMLPAAAAGFSSMSSAAAIPLSIEGAEKNTKNPDLSRLAVPVTVNVHLVGDCFAIPIFAFAILSSFGAAEPSFYSYFIFAFYFVLAKFSVAAVPGGGILVMLPVLESQFGFTGEMASLITAIYLLFDPVITCANIMGNGTFVMILSKVQGLFFKKKSVLTLET